MSSKFLNANTDVNLSANSDSQIPSQKAVKTYVDNKTRVLATKEELTTGLSEKQDVIYDLDTIRQGAALGATALQAVPDEYITETELEAKGYLTQHQDISGKQDKITSTNKLSADLVADGTTNKVVTATEKAAWNGKQDAIADLATIRSGASAGATAVQPGDLATVATSGSYADLTNKPTIPTVNNGTLTIQKNGTNVATFTANQSTASTANIEVPTKLSELTDDLGSSPVHTHSQYSTVANTVTNVVAGSTADKINVTKNGSTSTITINDVANATKATKATQDGDGRTITSTYVPRNFGGGVSGTSVALDSEKYGTTGKPRGYFSSMNILHTVKNYFYRADRKLFNNGTVTVTCSYDDVVSGLGVSMLDGSFSGHYPSINPSTMFPEKPFVWTILSSTVFEVTDVCNLFITGHRLGSTGGFTKYKLEVTAAYNNSNPTWHTLVDYNGTAVDLGGKHFGLYSSEISTSPAYHSVYGVRLTISGATTTIFKISQIMLLASRGTENLSDGLHALDVGKGGKVVGNITIPTEYGSFIGNLSGTASRATADASGNTISTTYVKSSSLATVATSGSYNDLTNKPTIPTIDSALSSTSTNAIQNKVVNTALAGKANATHTHSSGDIKGLAKVATSGSYTDLTNKPTIPAAVTETTVSGWGFTKNAGTVTSVKINGTAKNPTSGVVDLGTVITAHQDISGKQDVISDLATIRSGAGKGATAVQPGDLAKVATSGMYSDLTGTPGVATANTLGLVKPDGTTITVTKNGIISAVSGSGFDFEGTKAEFDAAVAAGTITADSVSLITDDVSGDNVATKADLVVAMNERADKQLSNTNLITNCILSAPNGVMQVSSTDPYTLIVNKGLKVALVNGYNVDRTPKSEVITLGNDVIATTLSTNNYNWPVYVILAKPVSGGDFRLIIPSKTDFSVVDSTPENIPTDWYKVWYNKNTNFYYDHNSGVISEYKGVLLGSSKFVDSKFTDTVPYKPIQLSLEGLGDYVVESQVLSDGSWYRKYKSGWVEQGGHVYIPGSGARKVTLLKPFADTNYCVCGNWRLSNHSESVCVTSMTVTSIDFDCTNGNVTDTAFWRAEGQGAE